MLGKRYLFLTGFLLIFSLVTGQGHEIKVKINGLKDVNVILGHYLNKSMYPDDTIMLDAKGSGVFSGSKLPEGMYVMYLPNTRYFDILMGADQQFSLEVDTFDFINTLKIKGSEDNQLFMDFQMYVTLLRKQDDSLVNIQKVEKDSKIRDQLTQKRKSLYNERIARIKSITRENPGLFVSTFLIATLDVEVPEPPRDANGKIDSTWQYYYYRNHYFDNFNISDARLLRTPLYEDKVLNYLTKVIPQIPDSLIPSIDFLIEKSRADSNLFRFMLITLFNYYGKSNIMGMDAVQVYIADKYYLKESWWSDNKFLTDLRERVDKIRPLLIGKVAPDMELMLVPAEHFKAAIADTSLKKFPHVGTQFKMHQLQAKYLVLIFWEADCGHCKVAVPELYKAFERSLMNKGVKVLAISTLFGEDGKAKWVDFVNQHGIYGWINAWNPYSFDFKLTYDVATTPQIYILDEDKKIIAKKIGPEQVEEIITALTHGK